MVLHPSDTLNSDGREMQIHFNNKKKSVLKTSTLIQSRTPEAQKSQTGLCRKPV